MLRLPRVTVIYCYSVSFPSPLSLSTDHHLVISFLLFCCSCPPSPSSYSLLLVHFLLSLFSYLVHPLLLVPPSCFPFPCYPLVHLILLRPLLLVQILLALVGNYCGRIQTQRDTSAQCLCYDEKETISSLTQLCFKVLKDSILPNSQEYQLWDVTPCSLVVQRTHPTSLRSSSKNKNCTYNLRRTLLIESN